MGPKMKLPKKAATPTLSPEALERIRNKPQPRVMSFAELREYNQRKQAEKEEEHQTEEQTEEEEHQTEEEEHSEGEEKEDLEEKENAEEEEELEEKESPEEEDEGETEEKELSEEEEEKTVEQEKKKKKKSKKKSKKRKKKTVEQQSEERKHKKKSKKRKRKDNEEETVEQQSEERKQKKKARTEEHPKGIPPRPIGSPRGQRYAVSPTQSSERTTSADHSPRVSQEESEAYHTPVDEASTGIHSSSPQPEHREDVNVEEQEDHENHLVDDWEMDDGVMGGGGMGDGGMGDGVMHPLGFYVLRSEWKKSIKIATRSYIGKAANNIEKILNADELDWFLKHEQFKHFFHMPRDTNHKSMGLWLLTARTARIEKKNEAWFVVNGGAIRYSLKEHALLSGLHCHDYPPNYQDKGSFDFVVKHFETEKVTYKMLEKEFLGMKRYKPHRKKMAVLYFLASVLKGNVKRGEDEGPIDSFLLKVVGNLKDCVTFPWGRWTFDECMQNLSNMMEKLEGVTLGPKPSTPFPSFITPLEILAFEAIPCLGEEYRKPYKGAHVGCPRMCKSTFKTSTMRGFTIEEIHETLGETKDITSILEPRREEQHLLDGVVVSEDRFDPVVDGWTNRLLQNQPVFFEELYKEDVLCRKDAQVSGQPSQQIEKEAEEPGQPSHPDVGDHDVGNDGVGSVGGSGWKQELKAMVKGLEDTMVLGFAEMNHRIDVLEIRVNDIEVTQRGEALNRDLPGVIYSEYHGPSHLFTDPDVGVDLLAKTAMEGETRDTVMTDVQDGEEDPEITEKVVSDDAAGDAEKEEAGSEEEGDDAAGDAEKEAGSEEEGDDAAGDAEKEAGSEEKGDKEGAEGEEDEGGGDDDDEDEGGGGKPRRTYSDLRKPPFERKVLRERKKQ